MTFMDRFNALGRGMQIMFVGAVLLLIDLFLPWQDFDIGGLADEFGVDATFSGWRGFAGVVLGLLTIALIAWIVVRIAGIDLPLPISSAMTTALLGGLVLLFAIIKILSILGDEPTIWAFIGLALALVIGFGTWQVVQGAGGIDTLKSEMPSRTASSTMEASPPMTSAPPPVVTPEAAPHEHPPTAEPEPMSQPDTTPDEPGTAAEDEHDHPHEPRST